MGATAKRKIVIDGRESYLWKDDDDGHFYVEIESPFNGISDPRDVKRLIDFLKMCYEKMRVDK